MSVFVLVFHETDHSEVRGVFSTEEKASEFVAGGSSYKHDFTVEEWEIDNTDGSGVMKNIIQL